MPFSKIYFLVFQIPDSRRPERRSLVQPSCSQPVVLPDQLLPGQLRHLPLGHVLSPSGYDVRTHPDGNSIRFLISVMKLMLYLQVFFLSRKKVYKYC